MIVYFADRNSRILYSVSNRLPGGIIISDTTTDDAASGFKTIELELAATKEIREAAVEGNLVLHGGRDYELFQIIDADYDAATRTIRVYGEDAGLDLINKTCDAWAPTTSQTIVQCVQNALGTDYGGWNVNYNVSTTATMAKDNFQYSADQTAVERLNSILTIWGAEMYCSYEIDGFKWIARNINIVQKRGSSEKLPTFVFGRDVDNITEKRSIQELATSFKLYGQSSKGAKQALSAMSGYSTYSGHTYTSTDTTFSAKRTHTYKVTGNEVQCVEAMDKWRSKLDSDGKILRVKETEYKTAKLVIEYAIRELEKICEPVVTYTVSFSGIPSDVNTGDYIRIVDEYGEIYLQARVISWKRSETSQTFEAEIGDFTKLESSKAEIDFTKFKIYTLSITSSNGLVGNGSLSTTLTASIYLNGSVITSSEGLDSGQSLKWYCDGTDVTSQALDDGFRFVVSAITEGHTYTCELVEES